MPVPTDAITRLAQYNVSSASVPYTLIGPDGYGYVAEWPRALKDTSAIANWMANEALSPDVMAAIDVVIDLGPDLTNVAGVVGPYIDPVSKSGLVPSIDLNLSAPAAVLPAWFSRASAGTFFDATGTLRDAASGALRIDHRNGACRGALIEESRTNQVTNNTLVGQVDGSPGTLPTGWVQGGGAGLTRTLGRVTVNGITYTTIRFQGTTAGTSFSLLAMPLVAAASGQAWTHSVYAMAGGSFANVASILLAMDEVTAADAYVTGGATGDLKGQLSATPVRLVHTRTLNGGVTIAKQQSYVAVNFAAGPVDFTIALGMGQVEQGASPSSVIKTGGSAATRAADNIVVNGADFSDNVNLAAGLLFFVEFSLNSLPPVSDSTSVLCIGDGTANEMVLVRVSNTGSVQLQVFDGGPAVANVVAGTVAANAVARLAGFVSLDNVRVSLNGGAVVTDLSATMPTVNQMHVGRAGWFSGEYARGCIRRVALMSGPAPTNAKLQEMSSP